MLAGSWRDEVADSWQPLLKSHEKRLDLALRAVGKLLIDVEHDRWTGTAFLVGDRLALTASFADPGVPALVHDCTTTVGSAGAPVLDLGTGYVVGIHTHSKPLEGGFAQPTWELARDPHVWGYAIGFWPDPRPPWLDDWDALVAQRPAPIHLQPSRRARWTVDDVPIDWKREEPKELERLLVSSIDAQMAVYVAENAGLPLGTVNSAAPPIFVWREILKKARLSPASCGLCSKSLQAPLSTPALRRVDPAQRRPADASSLSPRHSRSGRVGGGERGGTQRDLGWRQNLGSYRPRRMLGRTGRRGLRSDGRRRTRVRPPHARRRQELARGAAGERNRLLDPDSRWWRVGADRCLMARSPGERSLLDQRRSNIGRQSQRSLGRCGGS
jgi:hypothetical protein